MLCIIYCCYLLLWLLSSAAGSRIFVHDSVYDEFCARQAELAKVVILLGLSIWLLLSKAGIY